MLEEKQEFQVLGPTANISILVHISNWHDFRRQISTREAAWGLAKHKPWKKYLDGMKQ